MERIEIEFFDETEHEIDLGDLALMKGERGEHGEKGDRGAAFVFSDFTPEQLESLKVKGDPGKDGEPGKDGYTPVKGEDYFTASEIAQFKSDVTPVKGRDYFDGAPGEPGKDGEDGHTPTAEEIRTAAKPDFDRIDTALGELNEDLILQKQIADARWKMSQGIVWDFQTDTAEAYSKSIPQGAKEMDVKRIGGKSIVVSQCVNVRKNYTITALGLTVTTDDDGLVTVRGTLAYNGPSYIERVFSNSTIPKGHKCLVRGGKKNILQGLGFGYMGSWKDIAGSWITTMEYGIEHFAIKSGGYAVGDEINESFYPQIFDLTAMGLEDKTLDELNAMFPDYIPYTEPTIVSAEVDKVEVMGNSYPIPESIRNLEGYGWSAGTAYNEVDFARKKFIKRVGKATFNGSENWGTNAAHNDYMSFYLYTNAYGMPTNLTNAISGKFITANWTNVQNMDGNYLWLANTSFGFRIDKAIISGTTVADFKRWLTENPQTVYYELATPIETDISDLIPDGFLESISVEGNGTLTFKQTNDGIHLPIPNEEEYLIALGEVTA